MLCVFLSSSFKFFSSSPPPPPSPNLARLNFQLVVNCRLSFALYVATKSTLESKGTFIFCCWLYVAVNYSNPYPSCLGVKAAKQNQPTKQQHVINGRRTSHRRRNHTSKTWYSCAAFRDRRLLPPPSIDQTLWKMSVSLPSPPPLLRSQFWRC